MRKIILLVMSGLFPALTVCAQEAAPRADLSVGYSYFREGFNDGADTHGGTISGAGYLNNWLGVVGDFGVYHLSQPGLRANTYTFMGGPRLSANRGKSVSPFVQVLVGGDRITLDGGSAHGFSWGTGGGVDIAVSRHIAFRPQFDYIGLRFQNTTVHAARASFSIVFRFGNG
jgi:hypothetical protein